MTETLPSVPTGRPPATTLDEVARTADLTPLLSGDVRYVDLSRGQESLQLGLMRQRLIDISRQPPEDDSDDAYTKLVFSGHHGCGKTTELLRIEQEFSDRFYPLHLTLDGNLRNDFDYTLFLLWLTEQLVLKLAKDGVVLPRPLVENVGRWFAERTDTKVEEDEISAGIAAEAEAKLGFEIFGLGFKFLNRVKTEARGNLKRRNEIKDTLQRYAQDLINSINLLLNEARRALQQNGKPARLLIVQDNLDRLGKDAARTLFFQMGDLLKQVRADIIFTAPISTTLAPVKIETVFPNSFTMPMIKVRTADGQPFEPGLGVLRALVAKRIDPALFDGPDTITRLCSMSGGSVRDLVRLLGNAADVAAVLKTPGIDARCVDEAVKILRLEYERLLVPAAKYFPRLAEIHRTKTDGSTAEEPPEALGELLLNGSVLAYNGGEHWYDVHPVIQLSKAFKNALGSTPASA